MYKIVKSKFAPDDVKLYTHNFPMSFDEAQRIVNSVSIGNRLWFNIVPCQNKQAELT